VFDVHEQFNAVVPGSFVEQIGTPTAYLAARLGDANFMFTLYGHFRTGGVHAFHDSPVTPEQPYEQVRQYVLRLAYTIAGNPERVTDFTFNEPGVLE